MILWVILRQCLLSHAKISVWETEGQIALQYGQSAAVGQPVYLTPTLAWVARPKLAGSYEKYTTWIHLAFSCCDNMLMISSVYIETQNSQHRSIQAICYSLSPIFKGSQDFQHSEKNPGQMYIIPLYLDKRVGAREKKGEKGLSCDCQCFLWPTLHLVVWGWVKKSNSWWVGLNTDGAWQ